MSVCGNRSDTPGFFTSCHAALDGPCLCGQQVAEDLIDQTHQEPR